MPVYGTGFYPTEGQGAVNYFSIIHRHFNPFLIQAALRRKPIFLYLLLRDLAEPRAGGFSPITQPVQLQEFGGVISTLTFTSEFTASPISNPIINAEWNMAMYMIAMDVLATEYMMIQGEASPLAVVDTIKARFTDFYQKLLDFIETKILGAPANAYDMDGLANAIDDGTNYATYGNISRSTYPSWGAPIIDLSGITFDQAWQCIPYVVNKYRANYNGEGPNIVLVPYGVFHALGISLTALERIITATPDTVSLTQAVGFQALNINGLWIIPLAKLSGTTGYFVNFNSFKLYIHPDAFFAMTPWAPLLAVNVYGWRAGITFAGNFVCLKPWNNIKVLNMPSATL